MIEGLYYEANFMLYVNQQTAVHQEDRLTQGTEKKNPAFSVIKWLGFFVIGFEW